MGSVWVALMSNPILVVKATKKPRYHQTASVFSEVLAFPKQNANKASKSPAMIKIIQFILNGIKKGFDELL
ncbi:hypothetical protein CG09_0505 [Riemerella anatipestifer]|nr:hypothetical protein G148_1148 [Riemerella anatipestifer RA-CH-2]AKP70761.1 hypothetical protein CG09_0505 [Riemerella anatipestifer]